MRGETSKDDLVPLNLEIEATCRKKTTTRGREQQEVQANQGDRGASSSVSSSSFFVIFEEPTMTNSQPIFEEPIMVKDQPPRVTLEDYSSSSTP